MRKQNRFHSDIPIERKYSKTNGNNTEILQDISVDGLCFSSDTYFNTGKEITLQISVFKPALRVKAKVVWCHKNGLHYDTGVQFLHIEIGSPIRTVEFCQFLDKYKRALYLSEGKRLTCKEAYSEFMERKSDKSMLH